MAWCHVNLGLPWWLCRKKSACNAGDTDSIHGSGKSPGGGDGNPLRSLTWETPWIEEPGKLQSMGS